MTASDWIICATIAALAIATVFAKKLTVPAAVLGAFCASIIYSGVGALAVLILAAFFVLGTGATMLGSSVKQRLAIAEANKGRRVAGQVIANAGIATLIASVAIVFKFPHQWCLYLTAGAFSAATADTVSSEMGNVYGKRFVNIVTWKKDSRGLDGVVSFEGTMAGAGGSVLIAVIYGLTGSDIAGMAGIVVSGVLGNVADSILGATVERRGWLKNDAVNFLNTLTGATVAALWLWALDRTR